MSVRNVVPFHENFIIFEFSGPKNPYAYVYVHIERAHLVDLSFGDTAIFVKNGEKTKK